jgi:hypothetical protein
MGASKFGTICPKHERTVQAAPDDFPRPPRGVLDTRGNLENSPSPPLQFPSLTNRWAIQRVIFFLDDRPMRPLDTQLNSTQLGHPSRDGRRRATTKRAQGRAAWLAAPVELRIHLFLRIVVFVPWARLSATRGAVALRNASKAFSTEADCSCVVLSSHSLAAAKRNHPVRVAAKFTPSRFGRRCGPASSDSTPNHFRRSTRPRSYSFHLFMLLRHEKGEISTLDFNLD